MSSGTFKFDKFIDDITKREESPRASEKKVEKIEETGARKYNRLYRELWQNRVVWSPRKEETKK